MYILIIVQAGQVENPEVQKLKYKSRNMESEVRK